MKKYVNLDVKIIEPNPFQSRKQFKGQDFDDLKASIKEKGVLIPILVRSLADEKIQLVAGERRLKASRDLELITIPAIIEELSDREAHEVTMIENLQRKDLTPLEEAQGYKDYLEKNGDEAFDDLCLKTSRNPQRIRKLIAILKLPKEVLRSWDNGKIKFGHLEQLMRLPKDQQLGMYKDRLTEQHISSVSSLKNEIDNWAPELKNAMFDTAECASCPYNSSVQQSLFGLDSENVKCLNKPCFFQKQKDHLVLNWKKTKYYRQNKTTGPAFREEVGWKNIHSILQENMEALCKGCESFVTVMHINGMITSNTACVGDKTCFDRKHREANKEKSPERKKTDHGYVFREKFYSARIPELVLNTDPSDLRVKHLALAAIVRSHDLGSWFGETYHEGDVNAQNYIWDLKLLWKRIEKMDEAETETAIRNAAVQIALGFQFDHDSRHLIATCFGADLQKDWILHEEYLKKKKKDEIIQMGKDLGIIEQKKALNMLSTMKRKSYDKAKKTELIEIMLESIDLSGKVPKEILDVGIE